MAQPCRASFLRTGCDMSKTARTAPLLAVLLVAVTTAGATLLSRQGDEAAAERQLLAGAIDIHVHSLPDDRQRSIDAIDVARLAQSRGMGAIVLKNHFDSTAPLAWVVAKVVPGFPVFGGVVLNRSIGGINPAAVEHMAQVSGGLGRIVWMPTFDSENGVRVNKENRPFVSVMRAGALLPEVKEVLDLIGKHGLALATGHSSPDEALALLREARARNVQRMVVTHAMFTPVLMNVEQMRQAAALGAFLEFAGGRPTGAGAEARMKSFADAIRAIGVEHVILSTDLGQPNNPLPPDGFGAFLSVLRKQGFSAADIERMAKTNPAQLLGLDK
jgi:hypothetical protein